MANETGVPPSTSSSDKTKSPGPRSELEALRKQVSDLSEQVQNHLIASASAVLDRAGEAASQVTSGVGAKGREAVEGIREVKDNLTGAIDTSLEQRPYTTLAVAFGLGFLLARLR